MQIDNLTPFKTVSFSMLKNGDIFSSMRSNCQLQYYMKTNEITDYCDHKINAVSMSGDFIFFNQCDDVLVYDSKLTLSAKGATNF